MKQLYGKPFDRNGRIASAGKPVPTLLRWLLAHPYLRARPPKSTGRELFNGAFLEKVLRKSAGAAPEDIIHTVALFTPLSIRDAYVRFVQRRTKVQELIVSGGGAKNAFFFEALREVFGGVRVRTSDDAGMSGDAKEAICFAILANETMAGNPANLPRVTGARRAVVLGVVAKP
jgi:anhydro-N-acetylmuramic acid kinase